MTRVFGSGVRRFGAWEAPWAPALFGVALIAAACAPVTADPVSMPAPDRGLRAANAPDGPLGAPASLVAYPILSTEQAATETARLRRAFGSEVLAAAATAVPPAILTEPVRQAQTLLGRSDHVIDRPQLVVVVDRNPHAQRLFVVVARPQGDWEVIGSARVSTGQPGRMDHYITPVGVFAHTDAILDYRAEGTFNENHIRGLGTKGMRVWDFGWQTATKGWRADAEQGDIRLLMHATDPEYLEQRLGRPASQGCVRLPDAMNRFLDRHGVLDADYERAALDDIRYRALLLPDRQPTPLAGNVMVVVDTSGTS